MRSKPTNKETCDGWLKQGDAGEKKDPRAPTHESSDSVRNPCIGISPLSARMSSILNAWHGLPLRFGKE